MYHSYLLESILISIITYAFGHLLSCFLPMPLPPDSFASSHHSVCMSLLQHLATMTKSPHRQFILGVSDLRNIKIEDGQLTNYDSSIMHNALHTCMMMHVKAPAVSGCSMGLLYWGIIARARPYLSFSGTKLQRAENAKL